MGRRRLYNERVVMVGFSLPPALKEQVRRKAMAEATSDSVIVRQALIAYFAQQSHDSGADSPESAEARKETTFP